MPCSNLVALKYQDYNRNSFQIKIREPGTYRAELQLKERWARPSWGRKAGKSPNSSAACQAQRGLYNICRAKAI
jgi:hypothetical protein